MVKTSDYIDIQLDILALAFPKYCEQELLCKLIPVNKCRKSCFSSRYKFLFKVLVSQYGGRTEDQNLLLCLAPGKVWAVLVFNIISPFNHSMYQKLLKGCPIVIFENLMFM